MVIVLDTETTGFSSKNDDILQLAITDLQGNVLFNEYFKPVQKLVWPEAQAVNNISPEFVADKPYIKDRLPVIQEIFSKADIIVGYNTDFDLNFLKETGLCVNPGTKLIDVMKSFAPIMGEKADFKHQNRSYMGFKFQKLITAAKFFNYDWENSPHDALGDAKATAFVLREIFLNYPKYLTDEEWVKTRGEIDR